MSTAPIPTGPTGPTSNRPNGLRIAIIAVGALLLVAIVVIAFLIGQKSGGDGVNASNQNPTTSPSPVSGTPSESAAPTDDSSSGNNNNGQNSTDNSTRFTSFNADPNVACDESGQSDEKAQPQISWTAVNATSVYWTPQDAPATADNGYKVDLTGNQDTMSASKGAGERYEFPCNHRQYFDTTVTIYGPNGQTVSKHVKFVDTNWQN